MKKIISFIIITLSSSILLMGQTDSLFLWENRAPGAIKNDTFKETHERNGILRVKHVTEPTIQIFPAPKDKANGTAVIICPGGGYSILAIEHEGYDVAKWLNTLGITGIVLKYRLPEDELMEDKTIGPLMDVQQAFRLTRKNAKEWNINPNKIGVLGFSAGGHLATTAATHFNEIVGGIEDTTSVKPNFGIFIYPVVSFKESFSHMGSRRRLIGQQPQYDMVLKYSNETQITKDTPPSFLVHSADDKAVPVENSIQFFSALQKYQIPSELHIYTSGGHGYGLGRGNITATSWPERCAAWLQEMGFIQ